MGKRKNKTTVDMSAVSNEKLSAVIENVLTETEQQTTEEQTAEQQTKDSFKYATAKELAELVAVAKSIKIREQSFHVYIENVKEIKDGNGEGSDNSILIGRYGFGSNGKGELISIWCRRKATERKAKMLATEKTEKHSFPRDYGLRFSQSDYAMFIAIDDCKAIIDSLSTEHAEIKHNEPRYSFSTLSDVTKVLASLYNAYDKSQQTADSTAEQQTETEQQTEEKTVSRTNKKKNKETA